MGTGNHHELQQCLPMVGYDAGSTTGSQGAVGGGIDPVGAIAVLNVASFESYSRVVTSWNASNETIGFDATDNEKQSPRLLP